MRAPLLLVLLIGCPKSASVTIDTDEDTDTDGGADTDPGSLCDDVYEPNDTVDQSAMHLPAAGATGLMYEGGAQDWYPYTVAADQNCSIELDVSDDSDLWIAFSYGEGHWYSVANDGPNGQVMQVFARGVDLHGHIAILPSNRPNQALPCTPYDLNIQCAECVDDGFEDNDSEGSAVPLELGWTTGLTSYDPDWFQFSVPAGQKLFVELHGSLGDIQLGDIQLSGPGGFPGYDNRYYNDSSAAALATLEVNPLDIGCGSYEIHAWTEPPPDCSGSDAFEPNDAMSHASALAPGLQQDLWVDEGSPDYLIVDVPPWERIEVWVPNATEGWDDLYVRLFSPGIAQYLNSWPSNGLDAAYWQNQSDVEQQVVIEVTATENDNVTLPPCLHYELDVLTEPCAEPEDAYEPNDSIEQPWALTGGADLKLIPSSPEDWFLAGTVQPGQTIDVTQTIDSNLGDIVSMMFDSMQSAPSYQNALAINGHYVDVQTMTWTNNTGAPVDIVINVFWDLGFNPAPLPCGQSYDLDVTIH